LKADDRWIGPKPADSKLINFRMRPVDSNLFDREHKIQQCSDPSVIDGGVEHGRRAIGQNGCLKTCCFQLLKCAADFRKWLASKVKTHKSLSHQRILNFQGL